MKILITGGHLTPALSVIEELKDMEVYYVGRKYTFEGDRAVSLEYEQIKKLNIPFFEIKTGRIQRKITRFTLTSFLKLPVGFWGALKIVKIIKPDVVLAFGSYVSVPIGIVAKLLGIPLIIHEQTLEAGFANRVLAKIADKICISWESSRKYFPQSKTVLTGNPVRREIYELKNTKPQENLIYISGGSSGSHAINLLLEKELQNLLKKFSIIHQTGDFQKYKDYDRLLKAKENLPKDLAKNYTIVKFLNTTDAAKTIAKSTLLVGRSGINTVTELIILEKPAFLIPLMFSQKNEQLQNARFLQKLGLAEIGLQKDLTSKEFFEKIVLMHKNLDKYKLNTNFTFRNASENIKIVLNNVCKQKTS